MSISNKICQLCGTFENLSLCGGCRSTWYCSHEHQKTDWKVHKLACMKSVSKKTEQQPGSKTTSKNSAVVAEASSSSSSHVNNTKSETKPRDNHIKEETNDKTTKSERPVSTKGRGDKNKKPQTTGRTGSTKTTVKSVPQPPPVIPQEGTINTNEKPQQQQHGKKSGSKKRKNRSKAPLNDNDASGDRENANSGGTGNNTVPEVRNAPRVELDPALTGRIHELHHYVIGCMDKYGICLVDNFLGEEQGLKILKEVKDLHDLGVFSQGQLVGSTNSTNTTDGSSSTNNSPVTNIRGDMIMWVDGNEDNCENIKLLMECVDRLVLLCKGNLGSYNINGRTKGMVACYPGNDTKYLRHIDNPNADGRCMTCIYYINKDWNVDIDGGLLRIFPEGQETVANVVPQFDRLVFFWSDRRNPHEVQAAKRCRYAITVWYFDAEERAAAMKKLSNQNNNSGTKELTSQTNKQ